MDGGSDSPFSDVNALDMYGTGSALSPANPIFGAAEGGIPWGTIVIGLLIVLVLIVIWRFSSFRENRVCISTDLADYWPSDYIGGVPRLPGQDYLPALGDFIPVETVVAGRQPWMVNANLLSSVAAGN